MSDANWYLITAGKHSITEHVLVRAYSAADALTQFKLLRSWMYVTRIDPHEQAVASDDARLIPADPKFTTAPDA